VDFHIFILKFEPVTPSIYMAYWNYGI